jgi:hypothetical protein
MNGTSFVRDLRVRVAALVAATSLVLYAAAAAVSACITVPPPDLPEPRLVGPTALHNSVVPPEGILLTWPPDATFIVPVKMDNPTETFVYNVFTDYYDVPPGTQSYPQRVASGGGPNAPDGGISLMMFMLKAPKTSTCPHRIDFVVAHQFNQNSDRVWDNYGGDIVTWSYYPSGEPVCSDYDSGDGSFPEASFDGFPLPPEVGGGP